MSQNLLDGVISSFEKYANNSFQKEKKLYEEAGIKGLDLNNIVEEYLSGELQNKLITFLYGKDNLSWVKILSEKTFRNYLIRQLDNQKIITDDDFKRIIGEVGQNVDNPDDVDPEIFIKKVIEKMEDFLEMGDFTEGSEESLKETFAKNLKVKGEKSSLSEREKSTVKIKVDNSSKQATFTYPRSGIVGWGALLKKLRGTEIELGNGNSCILLKSQSSSGESRFEYNLREKQKKTTNNKITDNDYLEVFKNTVKAALEQFDNEEDKASQQFETWWNSGGQDSFSGGLERKIKITDNDGNNSTVDNSNIKEIFERSTSSQVSGDIGELFFSALIETSQKNEVSILGQVKDKKTQDERVDIKMDELGFQSKNFPSVLSSGVFNLYETSIKFFSEEDFGNYIKEVDPIYSNVRQAYWYHKRKKNESEEKEIKLVEAELYNNVDHFLRYESIYTLFSGLNNNFYIINFTTIVPASVLFLLLESDIKKQNKNELFNFSQEKKEKKVAKQENLLSSWRSLKFPNQLDVFENNLYINFVGVQIDFDKNTRTFTGIF